MHTNDMLADQPFVIAADHGGVALKDYLVAFFKTHGVAGCTDLGIFDTARADFPNQAAQVADAVLSGAARWGILICGTGLGMSIAANRHHGIYAALCHDVTTARLAREHNDANVLVMGGRLTGPTLAEDMFETFTRTAFLGGRYQERIGLIDPKLAC